MNSLQIYAVVLCVFGLWEGAAEGAVRLELQHADGQTAFDPNSQGLMVGTPLFFVVISDDDLDATSGYGAQILMPVADASLAELSCRGESCADSILPAAEGFTAHLAPTLNTNTGFAGYEMNPHFMGSAGDWFILDYIPEKPGDVEIQFNVTHEEDIFTVSVFTINQVPTRDFNDDGEVDLFDFSCITKYWLAQTGDAPDMAATLDIHLDGTIDMQDLSVFLEYWLLP